MIGMKEQDSSDDTTENYGSAYTDEYGEIYPPHYYSMGKDYSISEQIRESRLRMYEKKKDGINISDVKYIIAFILIIWILFSISKLIWFAEW